MNKPEERLEHLVHRLRDQGYRLTPQRMAILQALVHSNSHPTAEEIYQQLLADFPMLSLATVYKTLKTLKDLGEILELPVDGSSHFDANTVPHPHLVCLKCHNITDLPPEAMVRLPKEAIADTGFLVFGYSMEIYGLCPKCQKQQAKLSQNNKETQK